MARLLYYVPKVDGRAAVALDLMRARWFQGTFSIQYLILAIM